MPAKRKRRVKRKRSRTYYCLVTPKGRVASRHRTRALAAKRQREKKPGYTIKACPAGTKKRSVLK
jgi:hypothetical protein